MSSVDLGFCQVFWLMFPQFYIYLTIVKHTSNALTEEGWNKMLQEEFDCFLVWIYFMACTSGFAKEDFWPTKPISILEDAVSSLTY